MKKWMSYTLLLFCISCIPVKLAPKIEDYKIVLAKRFKKDLPRDYAFVFEDPKDADEFYHYINTRFELNHRDVELNVPLLLGPQTVYMSFHERERITEVGNLIPLIIDGILQNQDQEPVLEGSYSSRNSHWYILITVRDMYFKDCLDPAHPFQQQVVASLKELKEEYLSTHNYQELLFMEK